MDQPKALFAGLALLACVSLSACGGQAPAADAPGTAGPAAAAPPAVVLPGEFPVLGVDAFGGDPAAHSGFLGVEGVVIRVFPARSAFLMVDVAEYESCGDAGCAEHTLAVDAPREEFQGELPASGERVLAVGEVALRPGGGVRLVVHEVRREGNPILRRTRAAGP